METVRIRFNDPQAIEAAVGEYAHTIRGKRPEVRRVIWFGSRANGLPHPGSDVDLCVIVSDSALSIRDRIPVFLPDAFPCGMDLFVYTETEFAKLASELPQWHAAVLRGRDV